MRLLSLLLALCITTVLTINSSVEAACTGSNPSWTSTPDRASVQTCVTNAAAGSTINVTAGNGGTWSSTIAINKHGLKIIGAGIGQTTISGRTFQLNPINGIEISGFTFSNLVDTDGFDVRGARNMNIHHNAFTCTDWNQWIQPRTDVNHTQLPSGVFHHNTFAQCRWVVQSDWGGESYSSESGAKGWVIADPLGTANALFFEDNTATVTGCPQGNDGVLCNWIDAHSGAAVVVRFNTLTNTYLECHPGLWPGHRGARLMEAYGNTFACTGSFCSGFTRPGLMKCNSTWWHNQALGTFGTSIMMTDDRGAVNDNQSSLDDCDGTSFIDGNTSPTATYHGWPCRDTVGQSTDAFQWNGNNPAPTQAHRPNYHWRNTRSGVEWDYDVYAANYVNVQIVPNRDVFSYTGGSFNGTSGVGQGTLASRPSTCKTNPSGTARTAGWGPGYWCTDCGGWNTSTSNPHGVNRNGEDGVLYVCTATNTWTVKYTPYSYPHPLQNAGGGGDTDSPQAPTGLTIQ